jgi:hypothetical protein
VKPIQAKLPYIVLGLAFLAVAGTFIWLAISDVPVSKNQTSRVIPNERFFNEKN